VTAYTDATAIAAYVGVALTPAQTTQAAVVAQAATDWIDLYLANRSWQSAAAVTNELHTVNGERVYLDRRPAVAITSVAVRQPIVSTVWTPLGPTQYELIDPQHGALLVVGFGSYLAQVSYSHAASPAPPPIALAATMIASNWLSNALQPDAFGIESVAVGQNDVTVKFAAGAADVPPEALRILGSYRSVAVA
jgi:hypothetical protein